ncbi:DUF3027 domain-containing protein [Nesterenkonia populi]|uniref:DUF3027 domain-containing protein n=1 Tax=Nesterenkonia populi TaxID=1591087 RepID=UPI0011BEE019|nr:DUF3027 domain-containing protein [Nesterenkonia populi]
MATPDQPLAAAVTTARTAVEEIAGPGEVGDHVSAVAEDLRLVTHRFAADKPGYWGWEWFATLARAPRSQKVTVCEVGMLPSGDALLAPEWVPWEERLNEGEKEQAEA